jgi:YbgC/YbaW family acyl-CoA thioester hydrolase
MKAPGIELPVTVEFEDVDSFRIAHHARLVLYLERARVRLFSEAGLLEMGEAHPVLYTLTARFVRPARLLDGLTVSVFVESIDPLKVALGYRVRRGRDLVLKASTEIAFMDAKTRELVPVPALCAERLERFKAPAQEESP